MDALRDIAGELAALLGVEPNEERRVTGDDANDPRCRGIVHAYQCNCGKEAT